MQPQQESKPPAADREGPSISGGGGGGSGGSQRLSLTRNPQILDETGHRGPSINNTSTASSGGGGGGADGSGGGNPGNLTNSESIASTGFRAIMKKIFTDQQDQVPRTKKKKNQLGKHNSTVDVAVSHHSPADSRSSSAGQQPDRRNWMGRVDLTISLVAATVGLGNLTYFPYLAYKHGAGTFLFPFILLSSVLGVPLFYLESCLGQLSGQGAVLGWKMVPLLEGVGVSICLTSLLISILHGVLCMYPIFYFGSSFFSPLPWSHCNHDWNTKDCLFIEVCNSPGDQKLDNGTCYSQTQNTNVGIWNGAAAEKATNRTFVFSSNEYWIEYVSGRGELGTIQAHLVLSLVVVWFLCFLALAKDVLHLGKIMIFSVLMMFMVLVVLVINGTLLPSGVDGVKYFLTPKWNVWAQSDVWFDACGEALFGVIIGTGVITTFTSYSRYTDGNPLKMSIIVVVVDTLTSILGGFVFFTRMGYLAHQLGKPIDNISKFEGSMMAYVVYPESILRHKVGPFLSIMFFFALSGLGITCQIAFSFPLATAILDMFPRLAQRRITTLFVFCVIGFLVCLPFTIKGGYHYAIALVSGSLPVIMLLNALMEAVVISWGYGVDNFLEDMRLMTGQTTSWYFKVCWKYVIPVCLLGVYGWMKASTYLKTTNLTTYTKRVASYLPILCLLLTMAWRLWRAKQPTLRERVKALMVPKSQWTRAPVKTVPPSKRISSTTSRNFIDPNLLVQGPSMSFLANNTPMNYIRREVMSEAKLLRNSSGKGLAQSIRSSSAISKTSQPSQSTHFVNFHTTSSGIAFNDSGGVSAAEDTAKTQPAKT